MSNRRIIRLVKLKYLSFIYPERGGFGEIFSWSDHNWRKYFTESPERRVYKWYIIPKIKNFRKNKLLSSSSCTCLREYDALKYKIASSLFIFITRSTENSFYCFKYLCFKRPPSKILYNSSWSSSNFSHIPPFLFTKTCQSVLACTSVAMTAWDIYCISL